MKKFVCMILVAMMVLAMSANAEASTDADEFIIRKQILINDKFGYMLATYGQNYQIMIVSIDVDSSALILAYRDWKPISGYLCDSGEEVNEASWRILDDVLNDSMGQH